MLTITAEKTVVCFWHRFFPVIAATAFATAFVTPAGFKPTTGRVGFWDGVWLVILLFDSMVGYTID